MSKYLLIFAVIAITFSSGLSRLSVQTDFDTGSLDLQNDRKLLSTDVFNCTGHESCSYRGVCVNANECMCDDGYITYRPSSDVQCNYRQKKALIAFLLEFFLPIVGAGEWYLGNTGYAIGQLIYFFGGLILLCIIPCIFVKCIGADKTKAIGYFYGFLWLCGLIAYWIYEFVVTGTAIRLDGNGAPIEKM